MEANVINAQTFSHQHAGGETYTATTLETARGMCPALGKLSLEEAGLLLELEAMGRKQLADQQTIPAENLTQERVEEPIGSSNEANKTILAEPEPSSTKRVTTPNPQKLNRIADDQPPNIELQALPVRRPEPEILTAAEIQLLKEPKEDGPQSKPTEKHRLIDAVVEVQYSSYTKTSSASQRSYNQAIVNEQTSAGNTTVEQLPTTQADETDQAGKVDLKQQAVVEVTTHSEEYSPADTAEISPNTDSSESASIDVSSIDVVAEEVEDDQTAQVEQSVSIPEELHNSIALPELPAPVVHIEAAMTQLIEAVDNDRSSEPNKVNAIILEIVSLPNKLESADSQEVDQLEESLESLIIDLFEEANISYTPELVESFVKLTREHYFEGLLQISKELGEDYKHLPQEVDTREFLQKLQYGLSVMKQAVVNFYKIGKSILRLYSPNLVNVSLS